ncbi:MAG TPA: hypothetical protein VKA54_06800, partial [Gemmatimonadaceae bacterium]|nr:hypothetical protein [Gemmatimonadaceae bacterium]
MRIRKAVAVSIIVMLATAAACGSDGFYPTDGGAGGGGGGGGAAGAVTIGSGIQFVSDHNGTMNPAVDTIPVGSTMTW